MMSLLRHGSGEKDESNLDFNTAALLGTRVAFARKDR
jgi:hypothetical protein